MQITTGNFFFRFRKHYRNYRCRVKLGQSGQMLFSFFFFPAAFVIHTLNSHEGGVCRIRIRFISQLCLCRQGIRVRFPAALNVLVHSIPQHSI